MLFNRRWAVAAVIIVISLVGSSVAAFADNVANNLDGSIDATLETMSLTAGGSSRTAGLFIQTVGDDGKNGCNLTGATTLVVNVASSNMSVVTVSPTRITFTSCGDTPTVTVTPLAAGTATVSVSLVSNTTAGTFDLAPASFTVNVQSTNTPPTLTLPSNLTAEASGPTGAAVNYAATANDTQDGALTPTCSPSSGATFALGDTTVHCSVSDNANPPLTANGSFTVTVQDTTAPTLSLPSTITAEATSASGAVVDYTATASDLVDGNMTPTCTSASGTFPIATTTVHCSATDAHGNTATGTFDVTVQDTTAPSFSLSDLTAEAVSSSGAVVAYSASATDIVDGNVPPTCTPASGATFALGTNTVSCSATDKHGNLGTGTFKITVADTTAPLLSLPGNITTEATSPGGAAVTFSASATDVVDGTVTPTCTPPSGATFALGTNTVGCSATDAHLNTATGGFSVTVQDTTPPTLSLPTTITAEATGPAGAAVSFAASATDLVDGSLTPTCSPASGSTFPIGATTVNCSATDGHNNTVTGTFTVTVQDTTAPTLSLPTNITAEATGPAGAAVGFAASATDLVDGSLTPTCSPASGSTFPIGATTVNCSATDANDNDAPGSFQVIVQDTTPPTLTLPSDATAEATGPDGAAVTFSASATDVVDGTVTATCTPASGEPFALGTNTVSCSATDAQGNKATGGFTVTVQDTTAPTLSLPSTITAEATSASGAVVDYTATASDLVDGNMTPTCTSASGITFPIATTTVHCSATDGHGNEATGDFEVTVQDTTAPSFSLSDLTAEAVSSSGAVVAYSVSATDIVDGTITATCTPPSGATFALGTNVVSCTATDAHHNKGTGTFDVTVADTTAPLLSLPGNITTEATSPGGAAVTFSASATDVVDGTVTATCDPPSGALFALGTNTVGCSATDGHNNTASGGFSVTVQDTTAPTLSLPTTITAEATGPAGAAVSFTASATDLVDGPVALNCDASSGSTFALGSKTVHCSATDGHSNTATGTFTVTVQDTIAPTLSLPTNITAEATGPAGAAVSFTASATDLVDGSLTPTCSPTSGSPFPIGPTTVNCSATDAKGNKATGSFQVKVNYRWTGFFQPIDNLSVTNTIKAGSAVPVKFSLGGYQGMNIFAASAANPSFTVGACPTGPQEAVEQTVTAGGSSLTYDTAAKQYVYVWKTDKTWAGKCGRLDVQLGDGSVHSANFSLLK